MVDKIRLFVVVGTRPEAIKLAPVILAARAHGAIKVAVCVTGQHADMVRGVFDNFGIVPDWDLQVMRPGQELTDLTCAVLHGLRQPLLDWRPHWVVVQGDTTTAFVGALAAFYQKIPVAHVEAGLRTGDIHAPWPEEMNRRLVADLATLHFAPVSSNADNLYREGVADAAVRITGNTGIDALKRMAERLRSDADLSAQARRALATQGVPSSFWQAGEEPRRLVLVTGHRRESFGLGFSNICRALRTLASRHADCGFVYPVHPNPAVREVVFGELGDGVSNIHLTGPLDYMPFVALMSRADLILTDSGGIQEEAPSLGKRVIVMRAVTEREEGAGTGLVRVAGIDPDRIVAAAEDALTGRWPIDNAVRDVYGDGRAAMRIVEAIVAMGVK